MPDIKGNPWASVADTKPGDLLLADGGFTCIPEGVVLKVKIDTEGELYVSCVGPEDSEDPSHERHYLSGQCDDGSEYVGFYRSLPQ